MERNALTQKLIRTAIGSALVLSIPGIATADAPPSEEFRERIPVEERQEERHRERMEQEEEAMKRSGEAEPEWIIGFSPVVTMNFFDEDRERPNYGFHVNVRKSDIPLNLRVGVEGSDFNSEQDAFSSTAVAQGRAPFETDITYLRFPIAVEYYMELSDRTNLYVGPGYNLIRIDDLEDENGSGLHVSGRIGWEILEDQLELTAEGGYMWTEDLETTGGDVDFSGPFVSGGLTYHLPI